MDTTDMDDIILYFAVIWKKLDKIERKVDGKGVRLAPLSSYLKELEDEVMKEKHQRR